MVMGFFNDIGVKVVESLQKNSDELVFTFNPEEEYKDVYFDIFISQTEYDRLKLILQNKLKNNN